MFTTKILRQRAASLGIASIAAAGLIGIGATAAQADTAIVVSGSTKSGALTNCKNTQRTYISSWTKITVSCYYSGYAGGKYWYTFHYTSVAG